MPKIDWTETPPTQPKPATTTPPPDNTPALTDAQLEERRQQTAKAMGWELDGEAPPKAQVEPAAPPVVPPPEPPTPVAPASEPPKPPAPRPEAVTMATEADLQRVADEAVRKSQNAPTATQTPPPATLTLPKGMTADDRRDYEVVKYLERTNPAKYSGKAAQFLQFHRDVEVYRADWETKNPNSEFDINADEHNDWAAEHDQGVDADEIDDARDDYFVDKATTKIYNEKLKPKEDAEAVATALARAWPGIQSSVRRKALEFIKLINPDLARYVTDASGEPNFSPEALAAIKQADAIAVRHLDRAILGQIQPLLVELYKSVVVTANGMPAYQLQRGNAAHDDLGRFTHAAEQAIINGPVEGRTKNGLKFTTLTEFRNRTNNGADAEAVRRFDSEFWTIEEGQIADHILKTLAPDVVKLIEEDDGVAKAKYGGTPLPRQTPPPAPQTPTAQLAAHTNGKPNPPSTAGSADTVRAPDRQALDQKSFGEKMADTHYRK